MNLKFLLVGLGNPGVEFDKTRHNSGFDVIDAIVRNFLLSFETNKNEVVAKYKINDLEIILLKPQTHMNKSGIAVRKIIDCYKILPENVMVFYDEANIKVGKIKLKSGKSTTHNGLISVNECIGTKYIKIGIGIDRPLNGNAISNYVLKKFGPEEYMAIQIIAQKIAENLNVLFDNLSKKFFVDNVEKFVKLIRA